MGFLADLLGGGALSGFLGGITGILGTWLKRRYETSLARIENQRRKDERDHEIKMMELEHKSALAIAEVERQESADKSAARSHVQSYKLEPQRFSEGLEFPDTWFGRRAHEVSSFLLHALDFFRGLMRPGLTVYMAVLVTWVYWDLTMLLDTLGIAFDADQAMTMLTMIVNTFLYLFTTAFVWWYGDRNRAAPPKTG